MALSEYEKRILLALKKKPRQTSDELKFTLGLDMAAIDHAAARLSEKGLVTITRGPPSKSRRFLDDAERYRIEGFPERRALKMIAEKGASVQEIKNALGNDADIAFIWLFKDNYATIKERVNITNKGRQYLHEELPQEETLRLIYEGKIPPVFLDGKLPKEYADGLEKLKKRKIIDIVEKPSARTIELTAAGKKEIEKGITIEHEISQLTPELIISKKWRNTKFREYDISEPVQRLYPGKRHFANEAMDYVRRIWLDMGFKEMQGPLIDTSFWVFDTLFVPQEHPAREMQDTFFVNGAGSLPKEKLVKAVRAMHEVGSRDSLGWNYRWSEEIAKKLVLRTHTTVLSAHTLAELKKADWPAKYFSVGRCFRNEALEQTHLFEFNQVEGIVVDENANFRHLIGYLKEFFSKLGFEKARFRPSYFPYTEPSIEIDVFHPVYRKWFELGGAGIFRPEVTEPLLGEPVPVLAWGPGFDRMIMDYYKIADIRDLYRNDVKQLRETRKWLMRPCLR